MAFGQTVAHFVYGFLLRYGLYGFFLRAEV
jgi:hypothetical protein